MKERLEETHGPAVELVRHFLARFFDNEIVAIPGEWQKVVAHDSVSRLEGVFAQLTQPEDTNAVARRILDVVTA